MFIAIYCYSLLFFTTMQCLLLFAAISLLGLPRLGSASPLWAQGPELKGPGQTEFSACICFLYVFCIYVCLFFRSWVKIAFYFVFSRVIPICCPSSTVLAAVHDMNSPFLQLFRTVLASYTADKGHIYIFHTHTGLQHDHRLSIYVAIYGLLVLLAKFFLNQITLSAPYMAFQEHLQNCTVEFRKKRKI